MNDLQELLGVDGLLDSHQTNVIECVIRTGSGRSAAKELGIGESAVRGIIKRAKARAARLGHAPGHFSSGVADGYLMGKVTVQRGSTGEIERTWERQSPHIDDLALLREAVEAMSGDIKPCLATPLLNNTIRDLLTLYTFTDFHLGALCWWREGGADWDTTIAENTGLSAMGALVRGAPNSARAIVSIQGDMLHTDGLQAMTPTSGHMLDADSRFGKVVRVAIRLIRALVAEALSKHEHVTLLICEGNHDIVSSIWLRNLFDALYENEPRITVHDSELPYYAIKHGKVMLGFHHGHMKKNDDLPGLFAAQFRKMWGECEKVAIHTGHRHHRESKEHSGAEVIQHPTIAARDAYAARGGWMAERRMTAITYHKDYGEVGTVTVCPEMLEVS